ncbi:alpha,alpha-trehalase [Nematocida homosporus]|uniref:alpha,alpha-trehalase n=1 Tax=Nematocida homosporus TaxID=1912981 RepID=UPI00221FAC49|nr:alpha,alpha-trehalase [Nematocida homosporus]KAI5184411.1 alpha,alpha-trehalase [Nematocida homosporus]
MKEVQPAKGRRRTVMHPKETAQEKARRSSVVAKNTSREFLCNIQATIQSLLDQEDTTKNKTITVEDSGPKRYQLEMHNGKPAWIEGNYTISTLLQELALVDINFRTVIVPEDRLNEDPMARLTRLIKNCFWKNLRRVLDKDGLKLALIDTKIKRVEYFLYVPAADAAACSYYKNLESALKADSFQIKLLKITLQKNSPGIFFGDTFASREVLCNTSPGLLTLSTRRFRLSSSESPSLSAPERLGSWHNPIISRSATVVAEDGPCPFYVPGGRFNEMYGWDSYFIAKGLIHSGELGEAMCIAENLRYQIDSYGKILNANRSYYLFRGNPPLFSTLIDEVIEQLGPDERETHAAWIESCLDAALKEYKYFDRGYNAELGLTRHAPGGKGIPMETEEGHFYSAIRTYVPGATDWTVSELEAYIERYNREEETSVMLETYLQHDRAVRESGHDNSKRVEGLAADLYTVDLNSLLYKTEMDILRHRDIPELQAKAAQRKAAINTILWNGTAYYDYNMHTKELSKYKGASTLYPLFSRAADPEKAKILIANLDDLVGPGGILTGTKESCLREPGEPQRQWDYPYGWAPHQMLAWVGLINYNEHARARNLALRWCTMVGRIFSQYNGAVTEKYNVEVGSHKVEAEYGNIGAEIEYVPREGFGWTNTSWLVGLALLNETSRRELYARINLGQ